MTLVQRLQELFPDADTVWISSPCGRMFLIIGHKRHTKDDHGQWVDQDGTARDWEYISEKVIASGNTDDELVDDAKRYKRLEHMTWDEYFAEVTAERASAGGGE